jgi:hypothetical protein
LKKIDTEVNKQLAQLNEQQRRFLLYYTGLTANTIDQRMMNLQNLSIFLGNVSYYNILYDQWFTQPTTDAYVGCREYNYEVNDPKKLGVENPLSELHGQYMADYRLVSHFFAESNASLTAPLKNTLKKHWSNQFNHLEWVMRGVHEIDSDNHFYYLNIMINTPKNTAAGANHLYAANLNKYMGVFTLFPGSCGALEIYRKRVERIVDLSKDVFFRNVAPAASIPNPRVFMSRPFYDKFVQRWLTASCSLVIMQDAKYRKELNFENVLYLSSVISCVLVDLSTFLKYKEPNVAQQIGTVSDFKTLPALDYGLLNIADDIGMFLLMTPKLSSNFNYTSAFSPSLNRYSGLSSQTIINLFATNTDSDTSYPIDNVLISKEPTNPTSLIKNQIHFRTRKQGFVNSTYVATPTESWNPGINYFKYMYYFEADKLEATQFKITSLISAGQSQVTYLALILIVIICALIMCFSFKYLSYNLDFN